MSTPDQPPQQPVPQTPPAAGYPPAGGYPPAAQPGYPAAYPQAGYDAGMPVRPKRPWNITLVAILILLAGIVQIIGGVAAMLARNDYQLHVDTGLNSTTIAVYGGITVVIGAVVLLLSFGLFGGSRMSRGVIAFFAVAHIAVSFVGIVLVQSGSIRLSFGWQIFWAVILLILLFAGTRTKAFFARG